MRQLVAVFLVFMLGAVALACGGGGSSTTVTPDFSTPAHVLNADTLPFLDVEFDPIVCNNKLWHVAEERVVTKTDMAAGDYFLWSSTNATTWTKVANVNTFPFSMEYSEAFIFDGKLWVYGEGLDAPYGFWWTIDGVTWTESTTEDELPFYCYLDGLFIELNGKLIVVGEEKAVAKVDNAPGDVYLWSTTNMTTWTKLGLVEDLPFDTEDSSEPFVYKNAMYVYAYPAGTAAAKIDRVSSEAMFYRTLDGIVWTMLTIALFAQERVSICPCGVQFWLALNYMMFLGYYVPETMKINGLTDEGEYLFYTKDFSTFTAGIATDDFLFNTWEASWFVFNNKLWAMAPTKTGVTDPLPGTYLWKIDL